MEGGSTSQLVEVRHHPFPECPAIISLYDSSAEGPTGTDMHSHAWAEVNIVLEGRGTWMTEGGEYDVEVGDAALQMPGTPHHSRWPAGTPFRVATIDFHMGLSSQSLITSEKPPNPSHPAPQEHAGWLLAELTAKPYHRLRWEGLPDWWQRLCDEEEAPLGPYRALRVESAMHELLARFADPASGQPDWKRAERRGVERALRHISRRLVDGPVTVAELARVACMSRSKFAELFRRMLGTPPHAYSTELRIYFAQSGLAGSRRTAASIGKSLGFSSPQHFSRAFKAATGLTPNDYRKRWGAPWVRSALTNNDDAPKHKKKPRK